MKDLTPVDTGTQQQPDPLPSESEAPDPVTKDGDGPEVPPVPRDTHAAEVQPVLQDPSVVEVQPVPEDGSVPDAPPGPEDASVAGISVVEHVPVSDENVADEQHTEPTTTAEEPKAASPDLIERLERRLDETLRLAERRDGLLDRLHRENQELRKGELQTAMLPLLRDLMRLHDDLERIIELDQQSSDTTLIRDALLDTLARNGVTRFLPDEGEPFDSRQHAAVSTRPTAERSADRTILTVRRAGFHRDDGSIVRVADVVVSSYRAPPTAEQQGPASPEDPTPENPADDDFEQNIHDGRD